MSVHTFDVAPGIVGIDTQMAGRFGVTASYLIQAAHPALIESGPSSCGPALLEALDSLGVGPMDLATVVVSHIHLDHAGGAGALLSHFPAATVWVHERGAGHLMEPERLVASTIRTYGADYVARMFGPVAAVPMDRIRPLSDGTVIDLGDRALSAIDAPGHAGHEVFLAESVSGAMFTGDGFGVFLPDVGVLRPATPAPEFDLELAVRSIRRAQMARPSALVFSHFGPTTAVDETCDLAVERVQSWTAAVQRGLDAGVPPDEMEGVLRTETSGETEAALAEGLDVGRYEFLSSYQMNAAGIVRYLTKRAETV